MGREKMKYFFVKLLMAKELAGIDPRVGPQILEPQGVRGKLLENKDLRAASERVVDGG
jgi:hypothetical protein